MRVRAGVGAEESKRFLEVSYDHGVAVGDAAALERLVKAGDMVYWDDPKVRGIRGVAVTLGINVCKTEYYISPCKQGVGEMAIDDILALRVFFQQRLAVSQYVVGIGANFVSGLPGGSRVAGSVLGKVVKVKYLGLLEVGVDAQYIGLVSSDLSDKEQFVIDKVEHQVVQACAGAAQTVYVGEESSYGALA